MQNIYKEDIIFSTYLEKKFSSYFPFYVIFDKNNVLYNYFSNLTHLKIFNAVYNIYYFNGEIEFRRVMSEVKSRLYQENIIFIFNFKMDNSNSPPFYIEDLLIYAKKSNYDNFSLLKVLFEIEFSKEIVNQFDFTLISNFQRKISDQVNIFLSERSRRGNTKFKVEDFSNDELTLVFWLNIFLQDSEQITYFNNILDFFQLFYNNTEFREKVNQYSELRRFLITKLEIFGPKGINRHIYQTNPEWIKCIIKISVISEILRVHFKNSDNYNKLAIFESINNRILLIEDLNSLNFSEEDFCELIKYFSELFENIVFNYKYSFLAENYLIPILQELELKIYDTHWNFFQSFHFKVLDMNYNSIVRENTQNIVLSLKEWYSTYYKKRFCLFYVDIIGLFKNIYFFLQILPLEKFTDSIKDLLLEFVNYFKDIEIIYMQFDEHKNFLTDVLNYILILKKINEKNFASFTKNDDWFEILDHYYDLEEKLYIIISFVNQKQEFDGLINRLKINFQKLHLEVKKKINESFANWFIGNYTNWIERLLRRGNNYQIITHRSPEIPVLTSTFLNNNMSYVELRDRDCVYFILIFDCLRYDFFKIIRNILKEDYDVKFDEIGFSVIPSATHWSRRALFAGCFRNQYKFEPNESKLFARNLGIRPEIRNPDIFYTFLDDELSIQNFIANIRKYNLIVIRWSDLIMHRTQALMTTNLKVIKSKFKQNFQAIFNHLLPKFSEFPNHKLIICSDHGWIQIPDNEVLTLQQQDFIIDINETQVEDEIHGRYFLSVNQLHDIDNYWVVPKNHLEKFGFPLRLNKFRETRSGRYNVYILKKIKIHSSKDIKRIINHGGISIDETILPFIVYEYNKFKRTEGVRLDNLIIDIISNTNIVLEKNQPFIKIKLRIINHNNIEVILKNIKIFNKTNNSLLYPIKEEIIIPAQEFIEQISFKAYQNVQENGEIYELLLKIKIDAIYKDENNVLKTEFISRSLNVLKIFDFANPIIEFIDSIKDMKFIYGFVRENKYFIKNTLEAPTSYDVIEIPFRIYNNNKKKVQITQFQANAENTTYSSLGTENIEIIDTNTKEIVFNYELDRRKSSNDNSKSLILRFKPKSSGNYKIIFNFLLTMYPIRDKQIQVIKEFKIYDRNEFKQIMLGKK